MADEKKITIKLVKSTDRLLQTPIGNDFGYSIVNGKHSLIKVLEFDSKELNEPKKDIEESNSEIEEL